MNKSEAQTRAELIDLQLAQSGWNIKDPMQVVEEFDILTALPEGANEPRTPYEGHQFSDYVLLGKDGKPLAVVEAKRTSKDAAIGREQAKQYCYNIQKQLGGELPFCFYTNGHETYLWDLENAPPRKVIGFPTRDDLERFAYIRRNRKPLTQEFINSSIAGRDYQIRAIRSVLEGIEQKKRDFLLVMATGTGKTRTCIAMVDALMRAGHAEKVLFLVDRIALREQALAAFKEHMPNEPRWPNVGEKVIAKDRRVYVATYPTMLNIIRDEVQHLSPHFFDFIVVDESHRSIYNTFGEVLDYFKTITLGLTATPTDIIDHNTFQLFHCEDGLPTFAYTFEEAVNNVPPYLCNFQVMKIQTKFQMEGISKRTISLEDQKKLILQGKEIEEINFEGSQLEKQVINKGNITGDAVFVTPATEYLSEVGARKARALSNGALLVACIAGSVESIGRAALTNRMVSFNQQINAIQPGKDVNPLYLYGLFKLSRAYIQSHATKGMKKILTKGDFEKITMIKPPLEIQNHFAAIVEKVEGIKFRYQQSLTDLEALYGALSQQAFKGELVLSRVPMPDIEPEEGKIVEAEPLHLPAGQDFAINLPDTDNMLDALQNGEARKGVIAQWLEAYRSQLGSTLFSVQHFMATAQARLVELQPENDFALGANDYEHIKAWVFEALAVGRLAQAFDDAGNSIELKAVQA